MSQQSDEELVSDSRNGDMKAFKAIVEKYEGKVAGVVKSMLNDTPETVDIGQEVFIRFYESLGQFKGESTLSTYLIRIAINLSLNEIKRRKRRNLFFSPEDAGRHAIVESDDNDLKEMLLHEITKLEPDFKSVVTLRLIEGYSSEETSDILNIPLGTVLSRLSRAQKKLKSILSKHTKP